MTADDVVVLFRPVEQKELDLIRASGWKRFPPRLETQPIFYPVIREEYATKIAKDWNTKDAASGFVGFVLRFAVRSTYLSRHELHDAGGKHHQEYWIPSDELDDFNQNIVGVIESIHEFRA